jgi:hypothetical protein
MALFLPSTPIIVIWMIADRTSRSYGSLQSPTNTGPAPDGPLPRFPYMGWLICCAVVSPSLVGLVLVFFLILGSIYPGTLAFYRRKTLFHFENRGQYVLADSTDNICISSYSSLLLLIIPCYVSSEPSWWQFCALQCVSNPEYCWSGLDWGWCLSIGCWFFDWKWGSLFRLRYSIICWKRGAL